MIYCWFFLFLTIFWNKRKSVQQHHEGCLWNKQLKSSLVMPWTEVYVHPNHLIRISLKQHRRQKHNVKSWLRHSASLILSVITISDTTVKQHFDFPPTPSFSLSLPTIHSTSSAINLPGLAYSVQKRYSFKNRALVLGRTSQGMEAKYITVSHNGLFHTQLSYTNSITAGLSYCFNSCNC